MTENPTGIVAPSAGFSTPATTEFQSQVDPQALQKLFDADPETLSEEDIQTICIELRKQRARFEIDESAKAMKEKKPRAKKSADSPSLGQLPLSLDDLNL